MDYTNRSHANNSRLAFKKIWNTFRDKVTKADIERISGRNTDLTFVSWSVAYDIANSYFPTIVTWETFDNATEGGTVTEECRRADDGTATVTVNITILCDLESGGSPGDAQKDFVYPVTRTWTHPIMRNAQTIARNPTIEMINKAKMRAMVKCLAFFGLGLSLWTGDDLPDPKADDAKIEPPEVPPEIAKAQTKTLDKYLQVKSLIGNPPPRFQDGPVWFPANFDGVDVSAESKTLNDAIEMVGDPTVCNSYKQLDHLHSALEDYETAIKFPRALAIELDPNEPDEWHAGHPDDYGDR